MPGSGTRTFLEPDRYEAALRQNSIEAVVTPHGRFKARFTWAELHNLQLLRFEEEFPRVAYITLPSRPVIIAFAMPSEHLPVWDGAELRSGDLVFHSPGERFHQAFSGPCTWGVISLDAVELDEHGRTLYEKPLPQPLAGQILRPAERDATRLRRLHAQICRLAETRPRILSHPEVARAIEQDLILALVKCLATAQVQSRSSAKRRHARIMISFEEEISANLSRPLEVSDLSELIGVSERTLGACCAAFIEITPQRYTLLRRLRRVRIALRDADPATASVAQIAHASGFTEIERFAGVYQAAFGETPSTTLARPPQANPTFR